MLAVVLGLGSNALSAKPLPYRADPRLFELELDLPVISASEAAVAFDTGEPIFLDCRNAAEYAVGHVGGAFSVPPGEFVDRYGVVGAFLSETTPIIVYGDAEGLDRVEQLAEALLGAGHESVSLLLDGYQGWVRTGAPVEEGPDPTLEDFGDWDDEEYPGEEPDGSGEYES